MTWRDDLRPASFRGIHFFVAADSSRFGRRVVVHTYPQRDKPYVEDLGRRSREYQFDAFVIGPNYMEDRDAFIAACEEPGAGELNSCDFHRSRGTGATISECRHAGSD